MHHKAASRLIAQHSTPGSRCPRQRQCSNGFDKESSATKGDPTMAHNDNIGLMAHLMRRAGFGASRDELEARAAKGYEATVEELLNPESQPPVDPYELLRY